jgi:hypothetical protein
VQYASTQNAKEQENVSPRKRCFHRVSSIDIYFLVGLRAIQGDDGLFRSTGLNPPAALRSEVGAGALILKQRDKTIFAESIFDYSTGQKPAVTTKDLASIELNGVLEEHDQDRQVTGSKAVGLTDKVVKIDLRIVKTSGLVTSRAGMG